MLDAENDAEADIGGNGRIEDQRQHADEITEQYRVEPRPDTRHQGAPMRRHDPEQPARHAAAADQEIEQQHNGQERAHDEGQAIFGYETELI